MMYSMKRIVTYEEEIFLPKCMYNLKPINLEETTLNHEATEKLDLGIRNQVTKLLKSSRGMAELEKRQDQLLKKLDVLYERIKTISSLCSVPDHDKMNTVINKTQVQVSSIHLPDEIVITTSPENLPWYLSILLKQANGQCAFVVTWHIHSTISPDKVPKILEFVKKHLSLSSNNGDNKRSKIRLIFKSGESEIKFSSTSIPIVGDVNILRYLSYIHPNILPYNEDVSIDALLDLCHLLQKANNEKNRTEIAGKLFAQCQDWIYLKQFSIVDVAAYNVIKQWPNCPKYVPRAWFNKCEKFVNK